MSGFLEPPRTLPGGLTHLSPSSVSTYIKCPERWRRRYLENAWEPASGAMILGSAAGAAEGANFQQKIESGEDLAAEDVLDTFSDEFELRRETEEIDWRDEKPGAVKDSGAKVLAVYHRVTAPRVTPVSVEREFGIHFEGLDWIYRGYLDFEEADGAVGDHKMKAKAIAKAEAAADIQPTSYLLARRAEGNPAPEFRYHPMVRVKNPEVKHVTPVPTTRTDEQLDAFTARLLQIASEIAWRAEYGVWAGAVPGSWWCSERFCGFWGDCAMGGKGAPVAEAVAV